MSGLKIKLIVGSTLVVLGMGLCLFPLYSELFTVEILDSKSDSFQGEPPETFESENDAGLTGVQTFTMMRVPGWVPAVGGIVTFVGGFLIGRLSRRACPSECRT